MADKKQKYFADQFDDEDVLLVFRKHPVVMRKGLVFAMLGPLIGVIPAAVKPSLGFAWFFGGIAVGIILGLLVFAPAWIAWFYSVFIVTDQRFIQITQKGMFHRGVVDIGLNQIQMVNYEIAGLQETMLGFGTIMLQTYMGDLVIHNVHHPARIQKQMLNILREQGIIITNHPKKGKGQDEETEEVEAAEA
ncbi:MAG: PH domain-containing protein [Patescibacteria group bacterium]